MPLHLGFACAQIKAQLGWVLRAGNGVCRQGKRQTSARVWGAASFARAQVWGAASFARARLPSLKPTHCFCSWILSYSCSAAGHQLTPDSGLRGGLGEQPPGPETALLPLCVHTATLGAIFVPSLLFIVPKPCAVGERCGVCFMIASFPPITFCLQTGFALILDPRPGSLGSVPPALAPQGSWGTEIPGSDPNFDAKLSANVLPFSSPGTFPGHKLAAPNLLPSSIPSPCSVPLAAPALPRSQPDL